MNRLNKNEFIEKEGAVRLDKSALFLKKEDSWTSKISYRT